MKQTLLKKLAFIAALIALPIMAEGQEQNNSNLYIDYGDPSLYSLISYYEKIPDCFFIQKKSDVSQNYITTLLDNLTNSQTEVYWFSEDGNQYDFCRVTVDEEQIGPVIAGLINDDAVITARRIYASKEYYDNYIAFLNQNGITDMRICNDPLLMRNAIGFMDCITGYPKEFGRPELVPNDSICQVLGLTYEIQERVSVRYNLPKNADFFDIAHKLLETGYISSIETHRIGVGRDLNTSDLSGSKVNKSDSFFYYSGESRIYYYEIQGRFFIQGSTDITHDYIISVLDRLIDAQYEVNWFQGNECKVIVEDSLIDKIIEQILQDGGIKLARRIYVSTEEYQSALIYPYLERAEKWFLEDIRCIVKNGQNIPIDNICNTFGLSVTTQEGSSIMFQASKNADIFKVLQGLYETGYFIAVYPTIQSPGTSWTTSTTESVEILSTKYYTLSGKEVENPSGLTIVVKRLSNGKVLTEKKLFR